MDHSKEIVSLALKLRASITAKQEDKDLVSKLVAKAQEDINLTLIPVVTDPIGSSLLYWGKNDDPTPGTLEELVSDVYKVQNTFKHRQLLLGMTNELKYPKLYVGINYAQRTIFISRM